MKLSEEDAKDGAELLFVHVATLPMCLIFAELAKSGLWRQLPRIISPDLQKGEHSL